MFRVSKRSKGTCSIKPFEVFFALIFFLQKFVKDSNQKFQLRKTLKSLLSNLIDLELLKNSGMVSIFVANLFGIIGYYIPLIFSTNRAKQYSVSEYNAALLLSIFG